MKKITTRIQVGLIAILAIIALSLILSQKANPNNPLFFGLKRVQEKAFLDFKSTPQEKLGYMSFLLNNRLEELKNIVNGKSYDYVLPSASRYSTLAGQMTDILISNNLTSKKAEIEKQFTDHLKILDNLYVIYPKNTENIEYKYIQDDFNYLKIYLEQLSQI